MALLYDLAESTRHHRFAPSWTQARASARSFDTVFTMTSWLRHYGNTDGYRWRREGNAFKRPLGFVEFSFDCDGRLFEGRADMNCLVKLAIKSRLSTEDFRERILLAWTQLRESAPLVDLRLETVRMAAPSKWRRWTCQDYILMALLKYRAFRRRSYAISSAFPKRFAMKPWL